MSIYERSSPVLEFIVCWSIGLAFSSMITSAAIWFVYKIAKDLGVF